MTDWAVRLLLTLRLPSRLTSPARAPNATRASPAESVTVLSFIIFITLLLFTELSKQGHPFLIMVHLAGGADSDPGGGAGLSGRLFQYSQYFCLASAQALAIAR